MIFGLFSIFIFIINFNYTTFYILKHLCKSEPESCSRKREKLKTILE